MLLWRLSGLELRGCWTSVNAISKLPESVCGGSHSTIECHKSQGTTTHESVQINKTTKRKRSFASGLVSRYEAGSCTNPCHKQLKNTQEKPEQARTSKQHLTNLMHLVLAQIGEASGHAPRPLNLWRHLTAVVLSSDQQGDSLQAAHGESRWVSIAANLHGRPSARN